MAFIYTNAINASHYFLAQRYPATMRIKAMGLELAMGMILQQSMAQRGGRHFGWQLLHPQRHAPPQAAARLAAGLDRRQPAVARVAAQVCPRPALADRGFCQ